MDRGQRTGARRPGFKELFRVKPGIGTRTSHALRDPVASRESRKRALLNKPARLAGFQEELLREGRDGEVVKILIGDSVHVADKPAGNAIAGGLKGQEQCCPGRGEGGLYRSVRCRQSSHFSK
jgi:hypothetical protein